VGTSGVAAGECRQHWMDIEFFQSDNVATGLDMGYHMPSSCGSLHCLCKLALGSISFR